MSFWIVKRDKTGRRHHLSISVPIVPIIALFGLLSVCILSVIGSLSTAAVLLVFSIVMVGFALLGTAKLSVILRGRRVSFGSAQMSPGMRRLYRAGYALLLPAAVVTLLWSLLTLAKHR
jgi:hypothetical protein